MDCPGRMTQIETSIRLWIPSSWPISFCCTDFVQMYSFSILCWYLQYQWFFSMLVAYHQYMCILSVSITPFFVNTVGMLMAWASLLSCSVCVVSSVEGLMSSVCVWTQVLLSPTASLFAFHWSMRWAFLLLVEGERCFFFWARLVISPVFSTGFTAPLVESRSGRHVVLLDYYIDSSQKQQFTSKHIVVLDYYIDRSQKQQFTSIHVVLLDYYIDRSLKQPFTSRHVVLLDYYIDRSQKQQFTGRHVVLLDYYIDSSLKQQFTARHVVLLDYYIDWSQKQQFTSRHVVLFDYYIDRSLKQ